MNILYGFSNCSYRKYNELFRDACVMVLQQAQKYHSLMVRGLCENGNCVQCISGLPVNRAVTRSLYVRGGNDEENGARYHYSGSINLPVFRQLMLILKSFCYTLFRRHTDVAICDILNVSILIGMLAACRLRRIPIVGIVTDVPGKLAEKDWSLSKRIDALFMQCMDGYVFLTEWMNPIVNPEDKPHVVIEGQVDSSMKSTDNNIAAKDSPKVMMYAGSIKKIYGIKSLTEAFISIDPPDWVLHIYGDGDYRDELLEICKKHKNIVYKGIKLNSEIVHAEIRASLLVNPRPTDEEYVKFSFPSKNMEYMVSGTPLLTTLLPGMPDEYIEYVYLIGCESKDGMSATLCNVLAMPAETLHEKGLRAKKFVLSEKNQRRQAAKVCEMLRSIVKDV